MKAKSSTKRTTLWVCLTAMFMALNVAMSSFGVPVPGGHLYLNDIIICTDFQTNQLISLIIPGREHDDRNRAHTAQPTAYLPAIKARQHEIQQQDARLISLYSLQSRQTITGRVDNEIFLCKILLQNLLQIPIIIDD